MTLFTVLTHLAAYGLGAFTVLLLMNPATVKEETPVANKFLSVLDDIATGLKKFFTSTPVTDVVTDGLDLSEIAWPELAPLLNGIKASIAKAHTLALAANVTGDSTAQVTALVLEDAQDAFAAYEEATGTTIETLQQQQIIQLFLNLLAAVPSSPAPAPVSTAPTASVSAVTAAVQKVVGSALAPAATAKPALAQEGPGLRNVVPE